MEFRNYRHENYEAVCDFLIELNRENKDHINWNWARFEWMYDHPEFDKSLINSIGLWFDKEKIVGAAIYDMYFGEAFCGALKEYQRIYPEILNYAYNNLSDESGLGIAICDDCFDEIKAAEKLGFKKAEQTEDILIIILDKNYNLSTDYIVTELNPEKEPYDFQWLIWQGFDHGANKTEFEKNGYITPQTDRFRRHFDPRLSLTSVDKNGEKESFCCLWYSEKTDYAYVEPVCTIPSHRGKGAAKAVICEALNRARKLGAKKAYVLSDMEFYKRLGFEQDKHFSFYWKK